MPSPLSLSDHKRQLKDAGLKFVVLSDWKGTVADTKYQCVKCKYSWVGKPNYVRRLAGCPCCTKTMPNKTTVDYIKELKTLNPRITVVGEYQGCDIKTKHRCLTCKHEWLAIPINIRRGTNCPKCSAKLKSAQGIERQRKGVGSKRIRVKVQGKTFSVQGYEPHAIRWLVEQAQIAVKDISTANLPTFDYTLDGKAHKYYPDMLVKGRYVVEVKSMYVAGITKSAGGYRDSPERLWAMLKAKAKAVKKQGFTFRLLVMNRRGEKVAMPAAWTKYSHEEILAEFDL